MVWKKTIHRPYCGPSVQLSCLLRLIMFNYKNKSLINEASSHTSSLTFPALTTDFLNMFLRYCISLSLCTCSCMVSFLSSLMASFSAFLVFLLTSFSVSSLFLYLLPSSSKTADMKSSSIIGLKEGNSFGFLACNLKWVRVDEGVPGAASLCYSRFTRRESFF